MADPRSSTSNPDKIATLAIIVTGFILFSCILACTIVSIVFILNTPWQTF